MPPGHVSLAGAESVKLASGRESERRLFGARQVPAGRPPDGMSPGPTRLSADGTAYEASRPDGTAPTPGDSEAVRRQAFDAAPDAVFAIDREYRPLFNNRNHQSMLAARGVGPLRTGDSVLSPAYPPEVLAFWRAAYDRALQGERFTLDIDETNPEGVQQWYANILSPLGDAQGAVIGVLVVVHDVSDRKRAEELFRANTERFRVALAAAPVVVFNQDRELRYTWVGNPALGMKAADAIGRTDEELLGAEMARPLTTIKRRVLDTGRFARTSC